MAFLDFMKSRTPAQAAAKPAPAVPVQTQAKGIEQTLSKETLAKAREVGARIEQATAHLRTSAPEGAGGGSNAALRQKQNNQDRTQAALSPTDRFKGQAATKDKSRGWER